MKENFEVAIAKYQKRVLNNEPIENIIVSLHDDRFTIIESMKVIRIVYKKSLADAKLLVSNHPVWNDVVKVQEPFHEELVKMMTDQPNTE